MNESPQKGEEILLGLWGDSYGKNEDAFGFEIASHTSPSIIIDTLLCGCKKSNYDKTKCVKLAAP